MTMAGGYSTIRNHSQAEIAEEFRNVYKNLNNMSVVQGAKFTATAGQTVFDLPFKYKPGESELLVFVGTLLQSTYTESGESQITFPTGLTVGTKVRIIKL